jgi:segregation and condensation protein A
VSVSEQILAVVEGQPFTKLPEDLYIPPQALKVLLKEFEGPLDLLLYLIKKQNLDILNIPIALITKQYMQYISLMEDLKLELAAEYLLMAAMLAEIKSRMLLPRQSTEDDDEEEDPRAELIKRLQEYERFKNAAQEIDELPRMERDVFETFADMPVIDASLKVHPDVSFEELMRAFKDVLVRIDNNAHHHIQREPLSIRERMTEVLDKIQKDSFVTFSQLFSLKEGKLGVVVTFIAVLELVKQSMIELVQTKPFSPIHITSKNNSSTEINPEELAGVDDYE